MSLGPMSGKSQFELGTKFKAIGRFVSGVADLSNATFMAGVSDRNARMARAAGVVNEQSLRRDRYRRLGATRAAYGASGVQMVGTPMDIMAEQAMDAELDALTVRFEANERAIEQRLRAYSYRQQGIAGFISNIMGGIGELLSTSDSGSNKGQTTYEYKEAFPVTRPITIGDDKISVYIRRPNT